MNAAQCLVRTLEELGATTVFGYPGGAIMPVYDAILGSGVHHILTRHEQGAVLAAIGYARSSGRVGVCLATSGPGATNLVTGLADAFLDSVPIVAITGQVSSQLMGTDAFQEVDIFGITMPIVKHSFMLRDAAQLGRTVREAFRIASSGRPGPVLIDIPKDVALSSVEHTATATLLLKQPSKASDEQIDRARNLLQTSDRPVLYIGGGAVNANASQAVRTFVEKTQIPSVATLKGLGVLASEHSCFLGMLGMHGLPAANIAVQECDLLISAGARFDDRVTGKLAEFAPGAKVVHLDVDPSEVGKLRRVEAPIVGDMSDALSRLATPLEIAPWKARCARLKSERAWMYDAPTEKVYAPAMIRELTMAACALPQRCVVTCDVGQHQMWVAQHGVFNGPRDHLTSGGLGTMGFGLPSAIGAQLADPSALVMNITGDGSFMMNVQELATVHRYALPIKIVLFDNSVLGMVRQWQELFNAKRYSEVDLSDNPDFVRVAAAFRMPGRRVERRDEVNGAIQDLLASKGPYLLHVLIDPDANVWPLVPPGCNNASMMEGVHA